jgi:hypothetical protein
MPAINKARTTRFSIDWLTIRRFLGVCINRHIIEATVSKVFHINWGPGNNCRYFLQGMRFHWVNRTELLELNRFSLFGVKIAS